MRTSSICPLKYSPQTELPPMRSAPAVAATLPLTVRLLTCTPFTNIRSVVPSKVHARCVQVLSGTADVPFKPTSVVVWTYAAGREALLAEYVAYARPPAVSFSTTERQPVPAVGFTHASTVMPVVRRSEGASATVTHAVVPLNESAPPNLPVAVLVALEIVPVFPW